MSYALQPIFLKKKPPALVAVCQPCAATCYIVLRGSFSRSPFLFTVVLLPGGSVEVIRFWTAA